MFSPVFSRISPGGFVEEDFGGGLIGGRVPMNESQSLLKVWHLVADFRGHESWDRTFGGGSNEQQILFWVILREFPKKKVHEVWVGNIMTPGFVTVIHFRTHSATDGIKLDLNIGQTRVWRLDSGSNLQL